jgi:CRISPR system Cascade subunit CasD
MINTLFLRLEGPLQSWGERSWWRERDTALEPTKSGVVGLLACAIGLRLDEDIRQLSQQVKMGVRIDQPGTLLEDYHTVGGGYDMPQLLQADGDLKGKLHQAHTELTYRSHLCDASFLVAIQSDPATIDRLAQAVQNPHWVIFLGRKACIPSRPLFEGVDDYPSIETALKAWPWYCPEAVKEEIVKRRAVLESTAAQGGLRRRHEIISLSRRLYGPHYTQDTSLEVKIIPEFPPFNPDPKGL